MSDSHSLYSHARNALEIMKNSDYTLWSNGKGISVSEHIKNVPGRKHNSRLKGKKGNISYHEMTTPTHHIGILLDSQDEPVEIYITEARPINLMTGEEIAPDPEENE